MGEDKAAGAEKPTNEFQVLLKRRLSSWSNRPWTLPDFFKGNKRNLLIGGEVISVSKQIDAERNAASKSKKIKNVYNVMSNTLEIHKVVEAVQSGQTVMGRAMQ
jgi:hypothetical protein